MTVASDTLINEDLITWMGHQITPEDEQIPIQGPRNISEMFV